MRSLNLPVFLSAFLVTAVSCKCSVPESPETERIDEVTQLVLTRSQFEGSGMQTGTLKEYDFYEIVHSNGYIEAPPQNRVKISAVVAGHIGYNPLLVGDKVKKGQVVAKLENPDFIQLQQDFAESAHQLIYLQAEYERQMSLAGDNIASQKVFARAESDFKSMKVNNEGLRKRLEILSIDPLRVLEGEIVSQVNVQSPINGFVSAQNLTRGMFVSPGDVLLEIIDNSHLHLELYIFETDALKVKEGQRIRFRVTQAENNFYEGEVILVGKSVEGTDRKVAVHGHINNEESLNFITGMFIEAEIIVEERKSLGLPNEAIVSEGGQSFIYVLKRTESENMIFGKRYVNIGQSAEELTEVFCENDSCTVLVKGAFNMTEGI